MPPTKTVLHINVLIFNVKATQSKYKIAVCATSTSKSVMAAPTKFHVHVQETLCTEVYTFHHVFHSPQSYLRNQHYLVRYCCLANQYSHS